MLISHINFEMLCQSTSVVGIVYVHGYVYKYIYDLHLFLFRCHFSVRVCTYLNEKQIIVNTIFTNENISKYYIKSLERIFKVYKNETYNFKIIISVLDTWLLTFNLVEGGFKYIHKYLAMI